MELIVFETEAYYKLVAEQAKVLKQAIKEARQEALKQGSVESDWLTLQEAQQLLPYRSKTKWQQLRDSGKITFSKIGRKILYEKRSILQHIDKYKI